MSVEELDFGKVEVDYSNLHQDNGLDVTDFTDNDKDELAELGEKLGVTVDKSQELLAIVEQLNEKIGTIEAPVVEAPA